MMLSSMHSRQLLKCFSILSCVFGGEAHEGSFYSDVTLSSLIIGELFEAHLPIVLVEADWHVTA